MDVDALQAILEASPESYDVGMLKPLKEQLAIATDNAAQAGDAKATDMLDILGQVVDRLHQEQITRLNQLATDMLADFEDAVSAKKDVEARWIDNERAYNGDRTARNTKWLPGDSNSGNSRPTRMIIKSRTLRYTARVVDMLLPANDLPIKVDPTPNPDPNSFPGLQQQQSPDIQSYAANAASRMNATIKDQMFEQRFTDKGRDMIFDGFRLGCGLMKGPFIDYRKRRKPVGPNSEIQLDESPTPGCSWVDPWMFFYDMTRTLEESSETYEVHLMDKRAVNDLRKYPNVIEENIDEILKFDDDNKIPSVLSSAIKTRNDRLDASESVKNKWAVVEMHGLIDVEDLESCMGIPWPDKNTLPLIEFWFCNGLAIKWKLSPMECDWRVPYYNFTQFPCDDTIFGYGIPQMGDGANFIAQGAMDQALLNQTASSGPITAIRKGDVAPMDDTWRIMGSKMVQVEGDGSVQDAIFSFNVPSYLDQNLELLAKAEDWLDDDILLDQITQGDINSEDIPASGMLQQINLRTVFQRMIAARADDTWFKPAGDRWMQWNLQFNPDQSIKGDFDVKGIASTTLVAKDLQIQYLQVAMGVTAQPQFAGFTDQYEILAAYMRMLDIPNRDVILFNKQQGMQNQQQIQQAQQADPKSQAEMAKVQVQQQELQLKAQQGQSDGQLKAQEVQWAHEERMAEIQRQMQADQLQAQSAHEANMTKVLVAQAQKETALIGFAQQNKTNLTQFMQVLQKAAMDNETKRFLGALDIKQNLHSEVADNARTAASLHLDAAKKAAELKQADKHKQIDAQTAKQQMKQPETGNGSAE